MLICTATIDDCQALAQIDAQSNLSPWSVAQFEAALANQHNTILLVKEKQKVLAFIVWQTVLDESELHLLAATPSARRRGLASQLLQQWFRQTTQQNIQRLFLEVRASNLAAQTLYHQFGFSEFYRRKNYYPLANGAYEDAIWMERLC